MRRKSLMLVAFLLVLFIVPMSFINVAAAEYDYSPESIDSFGKTLPDNTLYYPDTLEQELFANAGSANGTAGYVVVGPYNRTFVLDGYAYSCADGSGPSATSIYLNFSGPSDDYAIEYLDLSFYADISTGLGNISIWDHVLEVWVLGVTIPEPFGAYSWCDFRVNNTDYWTGGFVWVRFLTDHTTNTNVRVDYGDITFGYITPAPLPFYATDANSTSTLTGDHTDTHIKDESSMFSLDASGPYDLNVTLMFTLPVYVESFNLNFYGYTFTIDASATTKEILVWKDTEWIDIGDIAENDFGWTNATLDTDYIDTAQTVYMMAHVADDSMPTVLFDYAEIRSNDTVGYFESFTNVSDWINTGLEGGDTFTSNGDVGEIDTDSTAGSDYTYSNVPSISAGINYIEIRYRLTGTATYVRLYYWTEDSKGGSSTFDVLSMSGDWETDKFLVETDIECVELVIYKAGATDMDLENDYLRGGPSNEMGWQHDGSSSASTDGASDGDSLFVTSSLTFDTDATTTASLIETSYYPFLELYVNNGEGTILIEVSDNGTDWSTVVSNTSISPSTHYRGNVLTTGLDIKEIRVNVSLWATVDYCQLYSIANYTYSDGGGNTVNDYYYVDDESLIVINDIISVMRLNHDPTLSVDIATYPTWQAVLASGDEYFRFRELLDTNTLWDTGIITGSFVGSTFEDFDILFYGTCELSAINFADIVDWNVITSVNLFFDVFGWHIINSVVLFFWIELSTIGFEMFLIFLGLAMIPLSTVYLVKGGRSDMSMDKIFYGVVVFIFGWALFLGGILG